MNGSEQRAECVFCDDRNLYSLPAVVAGTGWPVCHFCAWAGRTLLDEGAVQPALHCLHLTGLEIEQFLHGYAEPEDRVSMKWRYRVERNALRGKWRKLCPCDRCQGRQVVVFTDLGEEFGQVGHSAADTMPLLVLRSIPEHIKVAASDGSPWRAIDAVAKRLVANHIASERPPVGPMALAAKPQRVGRWVGPHGERQYLHGSYLSEAQDSADDAAARRYWTALERWGRGGFDGDYWINEETGEAHYCPAGAS